MNADIFIRPRSPFLEIAGVFVPLRSVGGGQPVLLTHGVPGDLRSLAPVGGKLSDTVEAIAVSLPAPPADARPRPCWRLSSGCDKRGLRHRRLHPRAQGRRLP